MEFMTWLRGWLARHPLKEPDQTQRQQYTADLMKRVHALPKPARSTQPAGWAIRQWLTWPGFAMACATALVVIVMVGLRHNALQVAKQMQEEPEPSRMQVAQLPPAYVPPIAAVMKPDSVRLAEAQGDDEQWLEQTLLLLEDLNESGSAESSSSNDSSEQWLEELKQLDEQELVSNS